MSNVKRDARKYAIGKMRGGGASKIKLRRKSQKRLKKKNTKKKKNDKQCTKRRNRKKSPGFDTDLFF